MGVYGSGLTSEQIGNLEKEKIKMALNGKIKSYDTADGPVYLDGTPEECKKVVLDAYDALMFQLQSALASSRAMERVVDLCQGMGAMEKYAKIYEEESMRFQDYHYEEDKEDE